MGPPSFIRIGFYVLEFWDQIVHYPSGEVVKGDCVAYVLWYGFPETGVGISHGELCPRHKISIEQQSENNTIKMYPIPAKDLLNIESLKSELNINHVIIYDINLKVIKRFSHDELMNNKQININDIESGVYLIKINTNNQDIFKTIIINN